jgi:plastocyanin
MRSALMTAGLAAIALTVASCGGGYGSSSPAAPTAPSGSSTPPAGAIIIDIVGINGSRSFSPNPATVPVGQAVVWHNVDSVTHRVLLDDGETDSGNIAPGAYSPAMPLVAQGPYHCTIHPVMVGTIGGS